MRDAVSLLELCAGGNAPVDVKRVSEAAGISPRDSVERTFRAVVECDRAAVFDEIGRIYTSSLDIIEFWQQLIEYIRDLMVVKVNKRAGEYLELTDDEIAVLAETAKGISFDKLALYAGMLDDTLTDLQKGTYDNRVLAEMTLVRMSTRDPGVGAEALAARIGELEERLAAIEAGVYQSRGGACSSRETASDNANGGACVPTNLDGARSAGDPGQACSFRETVASRQNRRR